METKAAAQDIGKRIISAPRHITPTASVTFRMKLQDRQLLDQAAKAQHRSRSDLVDMAIRRCLDDGLWHPQPKTPVDEMLLDVFIELSSCYQLLARSLELFCEAERTDELCHADLLLCEAIDILEKPKKPPSVRSLVFPLRAAVVAMFEVGRSCHPVDIKAARRALATAEKRLEGRRPQ